jgi:hypothetical protein
VTVCVAAIAGGTCVYGASDRMITSWVVEFEPEQEGSKTDDKVAPPIKAFQLPFTFANVFVAVVLSRALGHSSIQQSAVYTHIGDNALLAGADAAANAMGKGWIGTEEEKSPA